jgi:hypothetical protein
MIGTIRWNLALGCFGFILNYMLSFSSNVFSTAFTRSLISGVILFLLAFLFRWFLGTIFDPAPAEPNVGNKFDFITPDESAEIHHLIRSDIEAEKEESVFAPLNPPKLVSKQNLDPEEMVKALRHMSED